MRDVNRRIDTMARNLAEAKFKKVNHILVDVTAEALVHTLADTAAEGEAEDTWRHCD